jgi:YidC/Oxa1 family membrane protein insertase
MFTIKDSINNQSEKDIQLNPYARIKRNQLEAHTSQYIIHEGLFAWAENQLHEETYNDLAEDKEKQYTQKGGWFGVTDHYWMTNIIPPQNETVKARFIYTDGVVPSYQADYLLDTKTIKSGESTTIEQKLFSGAKSVELVDMYEKQGVTEFSYTIDWGWFFFFTKPIFYALNYIYKFVGNFGVAILCLTLLIKILFYPLANKSYRSMAQMKKLQPKLMELREKNKDDPLKQQQDLIALYKKEKVNPVSGCLPMIIQIPVFFALYKVLSVALEMRHAPFFGWIQDLSAKDPTNIFSLFGLIPFDIATVIPFLHIGIWPLLMGFTMWFQQRLNPSSPDPIQAQVMTWMPIIFTFLLGQFAAGLVIYWTWNNIISIAQQSIIMKQLGIPVNFNIFARKQVEQN